MKKTIVIVLMLSLIVIAGAAYADVANSRHNLSSTGMLGPRTDAPEATVCGFCHIPHGGDITVTGAPLWARDLSGIAGSYIVYGGTLAGANGTTLAGTTVFQPGANSLTCLACHDGTVGLGVTYKNANQATNYAMINNGGYVKLTNELDYAGYAGGLTPQYNPVIGGATGNDLTNDHPVGLVYTNVAPNVAGLDTLVNAKSRNFRFYGAGVSNLECGSCHDPHDTSFGAFLRTAKSTLCDGCHTLK